MANGSICVEQLKDLRMVQRMHNEPIVDMHVCVKEKEMYALLWFCVGKVMVDLVTPPMKTLDFFNGEFVIIVSHDG